MVKKNETNLEGYAYGKVRSKGMGKGHAYGKGKGPVGTPVRAKAAANLREKLYAKPTKKIALPIVIRLLKRIRGLYGKAWLVGGTLTETYTRRDFDIVITDKRDAIKIGKALGSLAHMAHFIIQKSRPPSPIVLEITGEGPEERDAV